MDSPGPYMYDPKLTNMGTLDLWRDGLLCAYEFIPAPTRKIKVGGEFNPQGPIEGRFDAEISLKQSHVLFDDPRVDSNRSQKSLAASSPSSSPKSPPSSLGTEIQGFVVRESLKKGDEKALSTSSHGNGGRLDHQPSGKKGQISQWIPIGWQRLAELFQGIQIDTEWPMDEGFSDNDDTLSVADLAQPYWQMRAGPTFWCHVDARHPKIQQFFLNAQWLHPAVSGALRDEKRLISDRMKHLLYEVPVRVAGGLLFELTGHSVGDPTRDEDDVPVVFRSWQSQNYLITSMHVKGVVNNLNVLGVLEVQDLVGAGGSEAPKCVQEVVAQLTSRLATWDDRMSRKHFFGAADEIELKYVNRKLNEDLALLSIILNQEVRRLATQVIRIKWSLHAREEIIHELMTHLKTENALNILKKVHKKTREMLEEQDEVRDRLFTVQDVMQSNVREKLQERSVRVTHNLSVIGGSGLLLSVLVGLFGINLDGIPGGSNSPHAFAIFSFILFALGAITCLLGIRRLGLKPPPSEEAVMNRKAELQDFVQQFQKAAEAHEKVHHVHSDASLTDSAKATVTDKNHDFYVLLQ
ncbi:hypothetical protein M758_7G084800 [Ceratodon purpureus]|nr:hypothetical protein M758_7G084800 [Ceratodon purpureus]